MNSFLLLAFKREGTDYARYTYAVDRSQGPLLISVDMSVGSHFTADLAF